MHFYVRKVESRRECDCWGKGNGDSICDGGSAADDHRGGGGWCKGDGGSIRDGRCFGDGGGRREMLGGLGRVCIGLGENRRGKEGAGDHANREDQKSQQAFKHRFLL